MGSITGLSPLSKVFMYGASKAALSNLSKNLAREYGETIRINLLIPGFFPAEQNRKLLTEERTATIMQHTPAKRFGEPQVKNRGGCTHGRASLPPRPPTASPAPLIQELVPVCILLASRAASSFINGAEIVVDGGFAATKI